MSVALVWLLCCGVLLLTAQSARGRLVVDPSEHVLRDEAGRIRVFHGVNVVYKKAPWLPRLDGPWSPFESFTAKDAALLQSWGLNAVRLGSMWPGVAPERGRFDAAYVAQLRKVIAMLKDAGVWALLDAHQDVLSARFCGEGAPMWAVQPGDLLQFPEPVDRPYAVNASTGFPLPGECAKHAWASYYPTYATSTAFQSIYDNADGVGDAFADFWAHVVAELGPKRNANVIGIELLNEPWAGDIYADPLLMVPGVADRENLMPLYERVMKRVRAVDDDVIAFFEPVTWDDFGVGFEHVPGGPEYSNRTALAVHFYEPPDIDPGIFWRARDRDVASLHTGLFLTEFGIGTDAKAIATMDEADARMCSWTTWEYKSYDRITGWTTGFWNANGTLDLARVRAMSRTYAWAVAGSNATMSFDHTDATFTLTYTASPAIGPDAPTEIYLNQELHYPQGYTVTLSPSDGSVKATSPGKNQLQVHLVDRKQQQPVVRVLVKPAKQGGNDDQ